MAREAHAQAPVAEHGATIYVNATVITMDPERPRADGVRIEGALITHVLEGNAPPDLSGEVIDLGGAVILPGLTDAHLHLQSLGRSARQLDLTGTESAQAVVEQVAAAVAAAPPGSWIRGRGWDQNDWTETAFPHRSALDAVSPHHPVWLTRIDGHAVWVNSAALRLGRIAATTQDPPDGEILRDAEGVPTGVLIDGAIELLSGQLPSPTAAEVRADVEQGLAMCRLVGLTGVHDMGTGRAALEALQALEREGALTARVAVYLLRDEWDVEDLRAHPPDREGLLTVVGVKLFADGALGSRGAALLAPYADRPESAGILIQEPEVLAAQAGDVHESGYQLAIHAIGDRGNRVALDAIELAQAGDRSRRHRIEHAQVVDPRDWHRFAELGAVASMQPTHATSDMPWAEARLGTERIRGAYAWRSLLDAGARLAFGSDAPVESVNPWAGIYAAVTRQDAQGRPEGGWRAAEALTVEEALAGFTRWAGYAAGCDSCGVIRPGSPADLTVVGSDPTAIPPTSLSGVETLRTIVAGREVFVATN